MPCIATINRGHKELIKDGVNGFLIKQEDYFELAKKIKLIMYDSNLSNKFIKNSNDVVKDFLVENTLKEMVDIYEK